MKIPLIITFMLLLLLPLSAASTEYLTAGVTTANDYQQLGSGEWEENVGTRYDRAGTIQSYFPVVGDVDNDDENEIVFLDNGNLIIANYTEGVGVVIEQSITHGNPIINTAQFYPTPALFDTDSTDASEIVSWNATHMLVYSWNGTEVVLNQSEPTLISTAASPTISNLYPVIKCAQGTQWTSGNDTCVVPVNSRVGAAHFQHLIIYDVNDNVVTQENGTAVPGGNADSVFHNTHLFDGDSDGKLEVYHSEIDAANGDMRVYKIIINSTSEGTRSQMAIHALAANRPFTDIIVSRLDGATPSVTWGYSSDGVNFKGYNVEAVNGVPITTDFGLCDVDIPLVCEGAPEGDVIGANMWVDDGTYSDFSGDVCYYIRNYAQNDPGINIDTVLCLSSVGGITVEETEIINSVNFTTNPIVHRADMTSTAGILTPIFVTSGTTRHTLPNFGGTDVCIPVDTELKGSMDVICSNSTLLSYFDDDAVNDNIVIQQFKFSSGNPVCNATKVVFQVELTDTSNDVATCNMEIEYINGTSLSNSSNITVTTPGTGTFQYTFNSIDNFNVIVSCKDQYHDSYTSFTYALWTSPPPCFDFNQGGGTNETTTEANVTQNAVDESIENTLGLLFGTSDTLQNIVGLGIVIGVMVMAGMTFASGIIGIAAGMVALIMVTVLGLVSAYILILTLVGLILVIILSKMVFNSGGGDS